MFTHVGKIALVALVGFLVACGPKVPKYPYDKEPDPRTSEYVVGIEDGLEIQVWKKEELSSNVIVRPDGTITMPLIGDLSANGKTPSELRVEIGKRLAEYVKLDNSEITIKVTQVNSLRFTVSGEVTRSGIINTRVYLTVAEAIAQAGGFTAFADRDNIVITRRGKDGKIRRIPIVYKFIENGTHPEMNIVMLPGDALYVP